MKTLIFKFLLALVLIHPLYSYADIGAVPGTLNQLEADPAEREVQKEYDELQNVMNDVVDPKESKAKEESVELPSHHIQEEPYRNSYRPNRNGIK